MLEPSPVLIAFLLLKSYFYLPAILLLALLRAGVGHGGWVRMAAGLAAAVAIVGMAARFGPSVFGLYSGGIYMAAFEVSNLGGGMGMPLLASACLGLAAVLPGARWRVLDVLHAVLLAALIGAWALAR